MVLTVRPPKADALSDTLFRFDGDALIRPVGAIVCLDPFVLAGLLNRGPAPGSMLARLPQLMNAIAQSGAVDLPIIAIRHSTRQGMAIELLDGRHRTEFYLSLKFRSAPYLTESKMVQPLLAECGGSNLAARQNFDFSDIPPGIGIYP